MSLETGFITEDQVPRCSFSCTVRLYVRFISARISGHNLFRNYCMFRMCWFEAVSGRKWHLPWVSLDMQQVQISLDLPFPRKINSDTLGSELHPIVPCLHAFSSLESKCESSHGLWSQRTALDPANAQILQETPEESRSPNWRNKEEKWKEHLEEERVSREKDRKVCVLLLRRGAWKHNVGHECWNIHSVCVLYGHIPELWPYSDIYSIYRRDLLLIQEL